MKPTKEHFDKIKQMMDDVYELKNQVDDHVADVAYKYNESKKHLIWGSNPSHVGNFSDEWVVNGNVIDCPWSDSWRYGGHDEGVVRVPLLYFYDDGAFEQYLLEQKATKILNQKLKDERELAGKKALFEQLKIELT